MNPSRERFELGCGCHTCRPITLYDMRMIVCPDCGNKRCPRATWHGHDCTNSNEPGQPGSCYGGRNEERYGGGLRRSMADELIDLGPLSPDERAEFLASIARQKARDEEKRQPHPQQKLDV